MAISNSERQARYRQRLKEAALGRVLVVLNVRSESFPESTPLPPRFFPFVPAPGDDIELTFQGSLLRATVRARRILEPDTSAESVVVDCIGTWAHDPDAPIRRFKKQASCTFSAGDRVKHDILGMGTVIGPIIAMVGPVPSRSGDVREAGWMVGVEWDDEERGESDVADRALKMVHRVSESR